MSRSGSVRHCGIPIFVTADEVYHRYRSVQSDICVLHSLEAFHFVHPVEEVQLIRVGLGRCRHRDCLRLRIQSVRRSLVLIVHRKEDDLVVLAFYHGHRTYRLAVGVDLGWIMHFRQGSVGTVEGVPDVVRRLAVAECLGGSVDRDSVLDGHGFLVVLRLCFLDAGECEQGGKG